MSFFGGFGALVVSFYTIYYTIFQLFANDWEWFRNHKQGHTYTSIVGFVLCALISIGQWWREKKLRKSREGSEQLLISFHEMVAAIVAHKSAALAQKAATLTQKRFDDLVNPEQVTKIMTESAAFLSRVFDLSEKQLDITILQKRGDDQNWNFFKCLRQNWSHGPADSFIAPGCAAHEAMTTGQYFLIPSKVRAAKEKRYSLSNRDDQSGDGSIFCNSLTVTCKGKKSYYVVSIVTYGKRLCDWGDDENIKKTEGLLREISRRFELELILKTIKTS